MVQRVGSSLRDHVGAGLYNLSDRQVFPLVYLWDVDASGTEVLCFVLCLFFVSFGHWQELILTNVSYTYYVYTLSDQRPNELSA